MVRISLSSSSSDFVNSCFLDYRDAWDKLEVTSVDEAKTGYVDELKRV